MLRSEAARYARWSAVVALVLAAVTALAYVRRDWVRHVEKKNAPPAAPVDVSRQSAGINFKKVEQNQTIFEVSASKSTEFKGQDASLLEDVRIIIFGKAGDRHDVIHTRSCRYGKENGGVACSGEVQIDLMSAADAQRTAGKPEAAKAVTTRIDTRGVKFDRVSGLAQTDQKVTFAFPSGSGEAVGLEYSSEEGTARLLRDVRFTLKQSAPSAAKPKAASLQVRPPQEVRVRGSSLDFGRDSRLLRLLGPAEAETATERLSAGEIKLSLDKEFHAETMAASGTGGNRPAVMSQGTREQMRLEADTLTAHFSPEGAVTRLDAAGAVRATRNGAAEQDNASAEYGTLELWPWLGRPKEVSLNGNALLETQGVNGESRMLRTNAFLMEFGKGESGQIGKAEKAETLAPGTMEWTDAPAQPGGAVAKTKLQADKLLMGFASSGKARQLQAIGNVQTERAIAGRPVQTATARNGLAELQATGGWSQMDLDGDVKLKEGERSGQGAHAIFVRASQTATLTGNAFARDASTETHAQKITFAQASGDIRAEGGVRSTDFASRSSAVQLAPAPANITADTLQANSKTGRAFYSGHARLWQGDSVLEAESIELLRETRVLNAAGNVRAVFPQATAQSAETPNNRAQEKSNTLTPASATMAPTSTKKAHLWHATSGTLGYGDKEGRAHLEQNVVVQSAEQRMRAPSLDLYFTRAGQPAPNGANNASSPAGAQQISRAVGTGGVIVEEGSRKATAERGEYVAAAGKFVMSGGNPTLYDGSAGTTTGRQLTFYLADDTIIVDSENGSRTLTKHRVEK
ncbi:MAG TPA: LPS export ABC transporter periplasmic protein LptC [Candidatus Acidoferrum sp.]|nr:LPS export ABC transporter periplasmic protein LptC [Candidatus Acidoferrum sp.]